MNVYQRVLQDYGVSNQSTSENDALLFALLTYGASVSVTTTGNPVTVILADLETRGIGSIAKLYVEQRLNTLRTKYNS